MTELTLVEWGRLIPRRAGPDLVYGDGRLRVPATQLDGLQRALDIDAELQRADPLATVLRDGRIDACGRVGFVQGPRLGLEVFPKYLPGLARQGVGAEALDGARGQLFDLLAYCGFVDALPGADVARGLRRASLADWFVAGLARRLARALERGVAREYDDRVDECVGIRGRPDVMRQVRTRGGLAVPHWCRFEEHDDDHPLSRLLALLGGVLRSLARTAHVKRIAASAGTPLEHIPASLAPERDRQMVRWTARNEHFRSLVEELSRLLLRVGAAAAGAGAGAWSYSLALDDVFESYVERVLRECARAFGDGTVHGQVGIGHLAVQPRAFKQMPDVVIEGGAEAVIVDAKYKRPRALMPTEADVRQLLAYAGLWNQHHGLAWPCRRVVLLYPDAPAAATNERRWRSHLPDVEIVAATIPFGSRPDAAMRAMIQTWAKRVWPQGGARAHQPPAVTR